MTLRIKNPCLVIATRKVTIAGRDSCFYMSRGVYVRKDITGQRFNSLTALRFSHRPRLGVHHWVFRCDCGNEVTVWKPDVIRGRRKTCGRQCFIEKFWKRIKKGDIEDDCWEWIGKKTRGYGQLRFKGKLIYAHRLSYIFHKGEIPKDDNFYGTLIICHTCDNPPCVNPAHLFLGTFQDNSIDRNKKGRAYSTKGKNNGRYVHGRNMKQ